MRQTLKTALYKISSEDNKTSGVTIDSTTQFLIALIGVVITAVGTIVAIFAYLQRSHKSVSFRVLASTPLLSVKKELKGKLKIYYESKEVEDVNLVLIEVFNSGNKEVKEEDYIEPITFSFGDKSRILSCEVVDVKPSFRVTVDFSEKVVTLSKTMLNAGDSLTLKALVTGLSIINYGGRITGVKKIQEAIPIHRKPDFIYWLASSIIFISILGMIISAAFNQVLLIAFFALCFLIVFSIAVFFGILGFVLFIYHKVHHN